MNDQIFYYWQSSFMRRTFLAVRWQRVNWMKKFLSMSCLIITKCGDYFVVLCSCSVVDVSQEDFDSINIQRRISSRADLNLEISSFLFSIDFEQHAFRIQSTIEDRVDLIYSVIDFVVRIFKLNLYVQFVRDQLKIDQSIHQQHDFFIRHMVVMGIANFVYD